MVQIEVEDSEEKSKEGKSFYFLLVEGNMFYQEGAP